MKTMTILAMLCPLICNASDSVTCDLIDNLGLNRPILRSTLKEKQPDKRGFIHVFTNQDDYSKAVIKYNSDKKLFSGSVSTRNSHQSEYKTIIQFENKNYMSLTTNSGILVCQNTE